MMRDLIGKLTNLEATAIKPKQMLTEDSVSPAKVGKTSFKDVFNAMVEAVAPGQKPLPVLDPKNQKAGMGFVTSNNPAVQNMLKNLDPKDVQIVQAPGQQPVGQQQPQQTGQTQAMGAGGATATQGGATNAPMKEDDLDERDEGKPGKNFAKIAKSAGKRYGSKEAGERVAGAIRAKLAKQGKLEEEQLDEKFASQQQAKLMYATAGGADTGVSKKVAKEFIKKSHGQKVGKLPKKVKEADIPSTQGIDTKGAGLGAGRSMTTLENKEPQVEVVDNEFNRKNYKDLIGKKYPKSKAPAYARVKEISEGAKPDFLDLDKDGNKKESMKKAAADKKKKKVDESMNHRISAARLEGKSHGLKGHAHCGKNYEELEERKAYCEGYKDGLDECYGMGVYETAPAIPAATVGGMAHGAMESELDEMGRGEYMRTKARATPGDTFKAFGQTMHDKDVLENDYAFESWSNQLNELLNEGLSVSVSKGQQNSPDSVTITAQDAEADQLLQLVKHAGLGLFGDDQQEPSQAMSIQPAHGEPDEVGAGGVDIDVVDGHDGMMGLMQKLTGIQSDGEGDEDYADEEGQGKEEHTCNECGMMEADCGCSHDKEQVDEVETEEQMTYNMAEDNAPDTGEAESTADEDAEAKEDADLAGADAQEEEEVNESFFEMLQRLDRLAEGSGDKPKHPEHDKKDDKDYDDEEDEEDALEESEELDEGKWNYPKHMTKTVTTSDMDTTNAARNREERKAFRKKEKAKAHAALMKGEPKKEKDEEELNEWANQLGGGKGKGTDAQFTQDIEFMTKVIAGGLNKPKSTGQTTIPVVAGQIDRMVDSPMDWATLAGIRKV